MGNSLSNYLGIRNTAMKRKIQSNDSQSDYDSGGDMHVTKRRKVLSTSKYIYKTLFKEGKNYDVTIFALGKKWELHKLYLSQSPYFYSMFNQPWIEKTESEINIGIEDPNITVEALDKVFGSFYRDEITIDESEAVPILAAAVLLQLDDLINQCVSVLIEMISLHTVIHFHDAAQRYGLAIVEDLTFDWLCRNTMTLFYESPQLLKQISPELMTKLIPSPKFIVVQIEFTIYLMLKMWLFLKENSSWDGTATSDCAAAADKYFESISGEEPFLLTQAGKPYVLPFRALRLKELITHHIELKVIDTDDIIPVEWFIPIFKMQWYLMLRVDQGVDRGPKMLTEEEFEKHCARCGRILTSDSANMWRWSGFNFGLGLVLHYTPGVLELCRDERLDHDHRNGHQLPRHLMYSISVYSIDKKGKVIDYVESKICSISLIKNEKVKVLQLNPDMPLPFTVSAKFLIATPVSPEDISQPVNCSESLFLHLK